MEWKYHATCEMEVDGRSVFGMNDVRHDSRLVKGISLDNNCVIPATVYGVFLQLNQLLIS